MENLIRKAIGPDFSQRNQQARLNAIHAAGYPIDFSRIDADPTVKQSVIDVISSSKLSGPPEMIFLLGANFATAELPDGQEFKRSTLYEESDKFGSLGGLFRVKAAAAMSHALDHQPLIIPSSSLEGSTIMAEELTLFGVPPENLALNPTARTSIGNMIRMVEICKDLGLKDILVLSSKFHMLRVHLSMRELLNLWAKEVGNDPEQVQRASSLLDDLERTGAGIAFRPAESILTRVEPGFEEYFEGIERLDVYEQRVKNERQGRFDIRKNTYRSVEGKVVFRADDQSG